MVGVGGGELGVEVCDVGYEVDKVVELLGIFARDGRGGRDEDLALRIVGEPLVVEFLSVRSAASVSDCCGLRKARGRT